MVYIQAIDFEYDGQYLSDYGFIICDFNFSNGANETSSASSITFNKVSQHQGKTYSLTSTQYNECITYSFDICKNPDLFEMEDMEITNEEYANIIRWLNRREFLDFCMINDEDYGQDLCYYQASFNMSKIKIGDRLFGIRLTMETNKPFGYGQEQVAVLSFESDSMSKILYDMSAEIGTSYPTVIITCKSSGTLSVRNETENCNTVIKNCTAGEVITLHGNTHIIESSLASHDVCNDFNYDFFRIGNTINNRANKITVSIPCEITVKYFPIIKDTP